jgi:PKD-like domain/Glycine rich protein
MIENTTTNRSYPKPDAKNFLQDDVTRINSALDKIDTDVHGLKTTKADQTTTQSALDLINTTKADKTEVDSKIAALKATVYSTAYNIIGPLMVFQHTTGLSYSIEIPDATDYAWTATGVTITAGEATKSITVNAATTSGSITVNVTTEAGNTVAKTKAITVKQLSNIVNFEYTGTIESWTVPSNVEFIKIEAWGAGGGQGYYFNDLKEYGGKGARMKGDFDVNPDDKFLILVGGKGGERVNNYEHGSGAGGGGSFVVKVDSTSSHQMTVGDLEKVTPLIIAGGGGGGGGARASYNQSYDGGNGLVTESGEDALTVSGGTNGNAGSSSSHGLGGAGFSGNGINSTDVRYNVNPNSFLNGGSGGTYSNWAKSTGGFGGGGGSGLIPGGGGGYSGGASGGIWSTSGRSGGGGSYNSGTNQSNTAGVQAYHGRVQISW